MYVSDYGYAASPNYWNTKINQYSTTLEDNWLYLGSNEWTITRDSYFTNHSYRLWSNGNLNSDGVTQNDGTTIRPVFYLSSCFYSNGTGEYNNMYRIL